MLSLFHNNFALCLLTDLPTGPSRADRGTEIRSTKKTFYGLNHNALLTIGEKIGTKIQHRNQYKSGLYQQFLRPDLL